MVDVDDGICDGPSTMSFTAPGDEPRTSDPDDDPTPQARRDELRGTFRHVFGAEIPDAERAWRRGGEDEEDFAPPASPPATTGGAMPETVSWALEALPNVLRELRAEVRRATDMATDALAAQSRAAAEAPPEATPKPFDPVPAALRELREEVREAVDRATETLAATRKGMDILPGFVESLRQEFEGMTARLTDALTDANAEAARAFALVAREVRTLGDRQAVLREEIRILGKRFEELERMRRRQGLQRPQPARRPATAAE
jgi:hypothetical protein